MTTALGVIPARLQSSRLPRKVLLPLGEKPLIQWVVEQARAARRLSRVVVATDHPDVAAAVAGFGGEAVLTAADHPSGTDRVAEAARGAAAEVVVNIQGDQPFLDPADIDAAVAAFDADPACDIATLVYPITDRAELEDPNVVKVVTAADGAALYFSRAPIPCPFRESPRPRGWHHIGLYAFRRAALEAVVAAPPGRLEVVEGLEQLRFLELGYRITTVPARRLSPGIDTPAHLEAARARIAQKMETA